MPIAIGMTKVAFRIWAIELVMSFPSTYIAVTGAFRARWSYSNATVRNLQTKVILDKRIKEKSLNLISLRLNLSSIKFCLLVGRWNIGRDGFTLSYRQTTPIMTHSPKTNPAPFGVFHHRWMSI